MISPWVEGWYILFTYETKYLEEHQACDSYLEHICEMQTLNLEKLQKGAELSC